MASTVCRPRLRSGCVTTPTMQWSLHKSGEGGKRIRRCPPNKCARSGFAGDRQPIHPYMRDTPRWVTSAVGSRCRIDWSSVRISPATVAASTETLSPPLTSHPSNGSVDPVAFTPACSAERFDQNERILFGAVIESQPLVLLGFVPRQTNRATDTLAPRPA